VAACISQWEDVVRIVSVVTRRSLPGHREMQGQLRLRERAAEEVGKIQ
jgi:hypothetical protein